MRIVIHPDKCIGAGHCVVAAPDVFDQNEDDGIVELLETVPTEDRREAVKSAARLCPALAIEVFEA
ncbi:ferredoxin [Sphingomonas sp.]|uniref:ferredoxin n=1 Tax=Sphingomonas sp. TaxID=28214 RepID=UPI002DD6746A|nr:ferredoxin [Sphingomonas sp.]